MLDLANVLLLGDGHRALLNDGTTLDTSSSDHLLALVAGDSEAFGLPVESDVSEDNDETDKGDNEGDAGVGGIGNGTLDRGEDGTTSDTHDEDTGTAAGVDTEVGSSHGEDGRVHRSHEEVDGHDSADGSLAVTGADVCVESDGADRVDDHDEAGREESGETSGNETTDGEGDQGVGEKVGSSRLRPTGIVDSVVDEEGTDGNLSTDIAELGDETADHVVLLPDTALTDLTTLNIMLRLDERVVALGLLSDLRKLSEDEDDGDSDTEAGNSEVNELHVGEVVRVLTGEESLGSDEGTDERSDTVPGLAELETRRGSLGVTNDNGVRVGGSLKGSKTAGDHQGASAETTERCRGILLGTEVSSGPEHDRTDRVESQTHEDTDLVTEALQNLSSNGGEQKVTSTEIHDLQTGGFELCNAQDILEVLVQDIEKTVRETPEEEQGGDEGDGEDELLASQETTSEGCSSDGDTAASHFYDCRSVERITVRIDCC